MAKVEVAVVEVAKKYCAPTRTASSPAAAVEVAVEVAAKEAKVKGLSARAQSKVTAAEPLYVPPDSPEPAVRELRLFPKEMPEIVEAARDAIEIDPAGTETVEVATREPTVSLPIVVEANAASVEDAEVEKIEFGKVMFEGNESVHVLFAVKS